MVRTEPIRNPKHVKALVEHYRLQGHYRNHLLITIGVYTALRISDILSLRCKDVYDFKNRSIYDTISLVEKKTGKSKIIALPPKIIRALKLYLPEAVPGAPLFRNELTNKPLSRVQAHRIIGDAASNIGLPYKVSSHSLRKTFGYHAWKNGAQPALLMEIYNHSSYDITKRYLGITQDDQNAIYRNLNI